MDLIPVTDNQEYIVCDRDFRAIQLSDNIQEYTDRAIVLGEDIREGLPEIIGLESTCAAILAGEQKSFSLESVTRTQNTPDNIIYFNLFIKSVADRLIILLENVTELMQLRQSLMQQLNESQITLNKLQRFEYCTNKIIASMRDVLLITTPTGKIERVNKSAIELFGYKKSQLLDRSIDNLIGDANFSHSQIYNFLLSSDETVKKIDINFINRQQQIHIEFDCFIVPTEIKNFYNCVYIGRDVTARKQAETEIRKSLAREKELRQLKSGFISMASHEFRNPLSSILLCVQNLEVEDGMDNSERQFYLQSIQDAAINMNSLLEDVLILSKAESGKQRLRLVKLNLREFCLQIMQELTSIYADKQIHLQYLFPREIVSFDDKNLRHILSNLLSNALKYSPSEATVNLKVSCSNIERPKDLIIEVRDRGIGIPEASQKHLFESFYRANNVGAIPGTGLGLSIVYQAVKLYQGLINIDSQENRGTTITVTLPINNI